MKQPEFDNTVMRLQSIVCCCMLRIAVLLPVALAAIFLPVPEEVPNNVDQLFVAILQCVMDRFCPVPIRTHINQQSKYKYFYLMNNAEILTNISSSRENC